jgi:histidinol dehydrogenase
MKSQRKSSKTTSTASVRVETIPTGLAETIHLRSLEHPEVRMLASREPSPSPEVTATVHSILKDVRERGDAAVLDYARRFDGLTGALKPSLSVLKARAQKCQPAVRKAIDQAIVNVRRFHWKQREKSWSFTGPDGEMLGQTIRALRRVGVYVPGGKGVYPSTLIMNTVPAQVAGVESIAVVTPAPHGLSPEVAYAAMALDLTELYLVGGAQAIGMLAYGTRKVERVDKIVGPGNVFAAVAKKEVFGTVDIDMIAGPSEILVMADDTADPDWVAADLLSQAEHGSGYEAAILITTSKRLAALVSECIDQQVATSPKRDALTHCLRRFGRLFIVPDWKLGCALADHLAPEHLEILTRHPMSIQKQLRNAGAIFVGPYSSEPVGDYFAGPNHVLPTNGSARFFSPLGVYDFYKRTSLIQYGARALKKHGAAIAALADSEGFVHHAAAVRKRLHS